MIYNDHFFAIEDQVQRLVERLIESTSFQQYILNKIDMYQDQEVATLRQDFTLKKEAFDKISAFLQS